MRLAWDEEGSAWRFVRLPVEIADEVRDVADDPAGFGSVRVQVRIGGTSWATSVCRRSSAATDRDFAGALPVDGHRSGVGARMQT